jgi:acyl-coenzyme A synthetase/AMP-(fatty) acid ligase/uncharacterized membrane protein
VLIKALSVVSLAVYAIASHIALVRQSLWLAFALALTPLVLSVSSYAVRLWLNPHARTFSKPVLVAACIISSVSLLNYWASLSHYTEWVFLVQNIGANAGLGLMFGATLRQNKTPLITQFAQILHAQNSADMLRYTRRVTWVWVLFFVAMCVISLGLFFFAPLEVWSAFINLLAWPLVGVMFAVEFTWRKYAHPEFEVITIRDGVQAFISHYSNTSTSTSTSTGTSVTSCTETDKDSFESKAQTSEQSPLIAHTHADQVLAYLDGQALNAGQFLSDVVQLAAQLPSATVVLNMCSNRYHFGVTLAAALLRQQICLLPSSHTPSMVAQLKALHSDLYCIVDAAGNSSNMIGIELPQFVLPRLLHTPQSLAQFKVPLIPNTQLAAIVFTSGSTGTPVGHSKTWGKLCINAQAEGLRLNIGTNHSIVGTVPAQHMYGFESTVLMPWQMGAALHAGKPFYPSDVMQALAQLPLPRCLVSTPFHLRACLDSGLAWPVLGLIVSATAPLQRELAHDIEVASQAQLVEIYGSTESGQLASRKTTRTAQWQTLGDARIQLNEGQIWASGSYIEGDIRLSDLLELHTPTTFTLIGRSTDMVNIAGKRSSLAYLSQQLLSIDGVVDGVIVAPAYDAGQDIQRLIAVVVGPTLDKAGVLHLLRGKVDAVFLPRQVYFVPQLPRNATGKLTTDQLDALVLSLVKQASL